MKVTPTKVNVSHLNINTDVNQRLKEIKHKNENALAEVHKQRAIYNRIGFIKSADDFFVATINKRLNSSISQLDTHIGKILN